MKQAYTVSTDGTDVYVAGKDNTLAKRPAENDNSTNTSKDVWVLDGNILDY